LVNIQKDTLLVTLDPVGNSGIDNKRVCVAYPSDRLTQVEKKCELQRKQRPKPTSMNRWINVSALGDGKFSDLVSELGNRWDEQANADEQIDLQVSHGDVNSMYSRIEIKVLGLLKATNTMPRINSLPANGGKLTGQGGELFLVKTEPEYLRLIRNYNPKPVESMRSFDTGKIIRRTWIGPLQNLPDGSYNLQFKANWSIHKNNEGLKFLSINKTGSSVAGLYSHLCFRGTVKGNSITVNHVHDMSNLTQDVNGQFLPPSSATSSDHLRNDVHTYSHLLNIDLIYPMHHPGEKMWKGQLLKIRNGQLFLALQFIPSINPSGFCVDYYRWFDAQSAPP
jgi:hypothetical protein